MKYDVIIVGAGPGGIFSAYELTKQNPELKVGVFEAGHSLEKRHCPIDGEKVKSCIGCKSCSIMSGFGGAGAFSDGKYNITNDFGGTLFEYIGKKEAIDLMKYVDGINMEYGGEGTKMYSTAGTHFKKLCLQNKLNLLDASVRHLGTDINFVVLENLYTNLKVRRTSTLIRRWSGSSWRRAVTGSSAVKRLMTVKSVSSPWGAAAASGWSGCAESCRFPRSLTGWTSACGWSCRR